MSSQREWRKATKGNPCPACGAPDWCLHDERSGLCNRDQVPDGFHDGGQQAGGGRLWFRDAPTAPNGKPLASKPAKPALPLATSGEIDRVYRRLLELLAVPAAVAEELAEQRGLTPERLAELGFGYLPGHWKPRRNVLDALEREFGRTLLLKVPGFIFKGGKALEFSLSGSGLLIPHRDTAGNVLALQVRLDRAPTNGVRYRWLSGNGGPEVPSAAFLAGEASGGKVLLTEGAFKAIAGADRFGVFAIGLPGANSLNKGLPVLKEVAAREVLLAYDADHTELKTDKKTGKPRNDVFLWLRSAVLNLRAEGFTVSLLRWHRGRFTEGAPKGLDDAILAGAELEELEGDQVDQHLQEVAALFGMSDDPAPLLEEAPAVSAEEPPPSAFSRSLSKIEELFVFFSSNGIAYLSPGKGTAVPLDSPSARRMLLLRLHRTTGKTPTADILKSLLDLKAAEVLTEGPYCPVFRRVGQHEGQHYLDLCRDDGRIVEMTAAGWKVMDSPPGIFWDRPADESAGLPDPVPGGDVRLLGRVINADEKTVRFLACYLACILRSMPYPPLIFEGSAGSAKTWATRMVKFMLDPEKALLCHLPDKLQDLASLSRSSHILVFDNVDHIKQKQSDWLCTLATGSSHKTRALYTNSDTSTTEMHSPVVLSGIDGLVERADLANRVALVTLEPIEGAKRREEWELWETAKEVRPQVLGGILDAFCAGLKNLSAVRLETSPRMVDFARFLVAAELGCPWEPGTALEVFLSSQDALYEQALGRDRVALAVVKLVENAGKWEGYASELLEVLRPPTSTGEDFWPQFPSTLGKRIVQAAPLLQARGVRFHQRRLNRGSFFSFSLLKKSCKLPTLPTPNLSNGLTTPSAECREEKSPYTVPTLPTPENTLSPSGDREVPLADLLGDLL